MPLLKELRGFSMHRVYKHHAPNGASYCAIVLVCHDWGVP